MTVGNAVDVIDVPVELARPVVAELTAGCLRGPVLWRGPGRWAVLTAPHRRAGFALPDSLVRAKVRLLPEGSQLPLPPQLHGGARSGSGDGDWVVPPGRNQLLPPCSAVVALLERVARGKAPS
ncbi:hypothetical protein CFN78_23935 [Amycolatopsis antarctica]|uniref:Uncharacterized protein n=1 Tax=Amycolatopsis antarctica TaxID=1854586 RepID=A0A263CX40_9PSEU|nr:hypothetical protein [Amycolatopsis antarctica]OZM70720.1 hypothetical protein CFN78_23935 [Amycolatopsis antarctica]